MSFLTPLYLLGALAIALPILAHLIRRTPPRMREFSSVMFLAPSLPKVTRRSRIEHWPLLLLRALVIGLLAFAFARPLWRTPLAAEESADGRWIAVLLDTSASMQREGLWPESLRELNDALGVYEPADQVGVFTFDAKPQLVWSWEAWKAQEPSQRPASVASALADIKPTWKQTDLAQALIAAAESLENEAGRASRTSPKEIVVISDMQSGADLQDLQGYVWPESIPVRLVRVGAHAPAGNAGLHPAATTDGSVRLHVTNTQDARSELFQIHSSIPVAENPLDNQASPRTSQQVDVSVPAGQTRVVRLPLVRDQASAATLTLFGDDEPFDNACFVIVPQPRRFTVVYRGDDGLGDPAEHRFYVGPLFTDTPERDVEVIDWDRTSPELPAADAPVRLVLLIDPPSSEQIAALRRFMERGGLVIEVLRTPEAAVGLAQLIGVPQIPAAEADVKGFSLLTDIDFEHPALVPFADPKFSDFTTLHFWKHRRIDADAIPNLRGLARFDNGDVALGEVPFGSGRVVFLTSGWSREDSQLAVWSKFVPLMNGLLDSSVAATTGGTQLTVGDSIPWQEFSRAPLDGLALTRPDGTSTSLATRGDVQTAEQPGFYSLRAGANEQPLATFAVNLAASESDTSPLSPEQLEALGIPLEVSDVAAPRVDSAEDRRDVANAEIEQSQRLWRWVLLAVVALLAIETLYAGWLTRRSAPTST